jgi:hypothetical protein
MKVRDFMYQSRDVVANRLTSEPIRCEPAMEAGGFLYGETFKPEVTLIKAQMIQ